MHTEGTSEVEAHEVDAPYEQEQEQRSPVHMVPPPTERERCSQVTGGGQHHLHQGYPPSRRKNCAVAEGEESRLCLASDARPDAKALRRWDPPPQEVQPRASASEGGDPHDSRLPHALSITIESATPALHETGRPRSQGVVPAPEPSDGPLLGRREPTLTGAAVALLNLVLTKLRDCGTFVYGNDTGRRLRWCCMISAGFGSVLLCGASLPIGDAMILASPPLLCTAVVCGFASRKCKTYDAMLDSLHRTSPAGWLSSPPTASELEGPFTLGVLLRLSAVLCGLHVAACLALVWYLWYWTFPMLPTVSASAVVLIVALCVTNALGDVYVCVQCWRGASSLYSQRTALRQKFLPVIDPQAGALASPEQEASLQDEAPTWGASGPSTGGGGDPAIARHSHSV